MLKVCGVQTIILRLPIELEPYRSPINITRLIFTIPGQIALDGSSASANEKEETGMYLYSYKHGGEEETKQSPETSGIKKMKKTSLFKCPYNVSPTNGRCVVFDRVGTSPVSP